MMRALFIALLMVLLPGAVWAQRVVGRVIDASTNSAVPNVQIRVESNDGEPVGAVSDSAGRFVVRLRGAARYRVVARHVSYAPTTADVEVGAQDQVEVLIRLSVTPLQLPPIDVVGRSRVPDPFLERVGYYERKSVGQGVFIDPDEIERRRPFYTTDLFRSINGVRVIPLGSVRGNDVRITRGEDPNCPPRVYIDRVLVRQGGRVVSGDTPIDGLIQPSNIHSIEIYRSPSEIPTEFAGIGVRCGVVLIWTKRGSAGG
jgi:hypothetical protein